MSSVPGDSVGGGRRGRQVGADGKSEARYLPTCLPARQPTYPARSHERLSPGPAPSRVGAIARAPASDETEARAEAGANLRGAGEGREARGAWASMGGSVGTDEASTKGERTYWMRVGSWGVSAAKGCGRRGGDRRVWKSRSRCAQLARSCPASRARSHAPSVAPTVKCPPPSPYTPIARSQTAAVSTLDHQPC
eukprot:301516-Pleurochrysis_carterae.AAC.2